MKYINSKKRRKPKPREAKPLLTNKDPGCRDIKHLKAINNPEGWYHL